MAANPYLAPKSWWLVGIALVAAFLGHDLLMAAPARAATYDWTPARYVSGAAVHPSHEEPNPCHPRDCAAYSTAVAQSVEQPDVPDQAAPGRGATWLYSLSAPPDPSAWEEPTLPAGVRRVLLRVFRL